jgi:hypothetical protein
LTNNAPTALWRLATRFSALFIAPRPNKEAGAVPRDMVRLTVQAASDQTADIIEAIDSSGNVLFAVSAAGVVSSAGGVTNPAPNSLALSTLVRGTNGQIPLGQTGAATAYETMSGEATITAAGVLSLAPGLIHTVSVALANADIKALRATPFQLVAAPGAGYMLEFVQAKLLLIAGTNVLTESTANLAVQFTNGAGVQVSQTVECTGFIDQAVNTITEALPKIDPIVAASAAANAALVLHNLGAAEFGGNAAADAAMKVDIAYRVRATA